MREPLEKKELIKTIHRTAVYTGFKSIVSSVNNDIANGYELDGDLTKNGNDLAQLLKLSTHKPAVTYKIVRAWAAQENEARKKLDEQIQIEGNDGFSKRGEPVVIKEHLPAYHLEDWYYVYQSLVKDGIDSVDIETED